MNLNLPLDYESTPEFWQLCENLRQTQSNGVVMGPRLVEMAATFLWLRLWVTLGYLAKSTNAPGQIRTDGMRRFEQSLEPIYAEDVAKKILTTGSTPLLALVPGVGHPEEWQCALFAKLNAHTAGDYKPGHVVGNQRSRLSAARKAIERDAPTQAQLLPVEIFKLADGTTMDRAMVRSCATMVMTLDRCLMALPRGYNAWTPGMMADAARVVQAYSERAEELTQFYNWLLESGVKHPNVPKTAEEILADFETTFALSRV